MLAKIITLIFGAVATSAAHSGTHWIVIPASYSPGSPIPLTFTFYNTSGVDVDVQVDLIKDDHKRVSTLTHTFKDGKPGLLQLQVPDLPENPNTYTLLIYGKSGVFFQEHGIVYHDTGRLPKTFAVHIQTDKGIYKPGQTIRFRAFGISSDLMVYTGPLNISIQDPKGNTMKRMVNVSEQAYGVIEDSLIMDTEPVLGHWQITATVKGKATKTKSFTVDKYVLPKFSIDLELPSYVITTDKEMHGIVKATYSYGKPVIGMVKLYADVDHSGLPWKKHGDEVMVESAFDIHGEAKFTVPFSRITNAVDPSTYEPFTEKLAGYNLQIKATVTESINNITRNASAEVKFYTEPYRLSFDTASSMPFFKPGLPYIGYISVTQADGNPVISSNEDVKLTTVVKFFDAASHSYNAEYLKAQTFSPSPTGSLKFTVNPPANASSLHLQVEYHGISSTMDVNKPRWLTDKGNIQISSNTSTTVVGADAIFSIQRASGLADLPMFYAVIANDRMVHSGMLYDNVSNTVTLVFMVTHQMKPYGKLVVYYFDDDVWNADALYFDVKEDSQKFKNKISLTFDKQTSEPGKTVSLSVNTDPQSLVSLLAVDQSVMYLAKGNDITKNDVIASLAPGSHASQDSAELHDPQSVLKTPGLQVLTNVERFSWVFPHYKRQAVCDCSKCSTYSNIPTGCSLVPNPSNPCCRIPQCSYTGGISTTGPGTATGGCRDKINNCRDYGRSACSGEYSEWARENCVEYCGFCMPATTGTGTATGNHFSSTASGCEDKISTCNLLDTSFYCTGDYFAWAIENCVKTCGLCSAPGPTKLQEAKYTRNSFPETWIWTNFSVGLNGTGILTATVPDTITSWFASAFSVNAVSGLGITDGATKLTSFRPFFINLNLPYSVVRGEEVVIQANVFNYMGQNLDVVVTLEKSDDFKVITHDLSGHTGFQSKEVAQTIHIPAGQAKSVFIPVVANIIGVAQITMKAQTVISADRVMKKLIVEPEGTTMHFNVPLILKEHTAVDVPLTFPPNVVADSQKIQVLAIGDTMGSTVKNLKNLLRMPTGCGEQTITSLAPDVFVYNYLKKTNQLTKEVESMTLEYIHKGYQRELTFQHKDGSFSIWGESDRQGSMWLTAFVLKSFHQARQYVYISDDVLMRAANWIFKYQNNDGSFQQIGSVHSTSLRGGSSTGYSLTAFVLVALTEAETTLRHKIYNWDYWLTNVRTYLENGVANNNITNAYDLAIVSYALSATGSAKAYLAYTRLRNFALKTGDGKMYWNLTKSRPSNNWEYSYYKSPPLEVEVASYALLYLIRSGQVAEGFPILQWLVSQRNSCGGFRSTQDTVLGLQAMSEYGAMFSGDLDLTIDVTSRNFNKQIHIAKTEAMVLKILDIPHSATSRGNNSLSQPVSVSLQAHGSGSALVQVSVSFNVETEVSMPAFNLTATIIKETLRSIVLRACASYLPQRYMGGGMAVMEIDIPSGFTADLESSDTKLTGSRQAEIRDEKTVVLYYDEIKPVYLLTCATIDMIRTDLVAKTKPAAVRVFDYYEPDNRAITFFESKLLKDSSYCDICSSCGC